MAQQHKTPTKLELLKLLADIDDKWYEIGSAFEVSQNILNGLTSSPFSNGYKLDQVIHSWLTSTESHLVTWETVIDAIKNPIVNNIKKATEIHGHLTREDIDIPSTRKRKQDVQTMELEQKHEKLDFDIDDEQMKVNIATTGDSDQITCDDHISDSMKIMELEHHSEERVISKETLDEVNRLEGILGDGPLRALCTTVYEDPSKLKMFTSVLKSEQTVLIGQDILKEFDQTFPSQVYLNRTYRNDFDRMKVTFGNLMMTVEPLIANGIPSLEELKKYLGKCFRELKPQLSSAESFDNVMELVEEKCTIINICCLEAIVDHYNIIEAKRHITEFKTTVDTFCEKVKIDICINQNFKITSSHHLTCETIEFILDWETDEHTLSHIKDLLSKAFKDLTKFVQVRAIREGNSIIVTCYAPQYMMDKLLVRAKENLDTLKTMGMIRLMIGYHTIYDHKEVRSIVEENTKLRKPLQKIIKPSGVFK